MLPAAPFLNLSSGQAGGYVNSFPLSLSDSSVAVLSLSTHFCQISGHLTLLVPLLLACPPVRSHCPPLSLAVVELSPCLLPLPLMFSCVYLRFYLCLCPSFPIFFFF